MVFLNNFNILIINDISTLVVNNCEQKSPFFENQKKGLAILS